MAGISNKFLAFVVVLTIGLSVLSTTTLLNKISILRQEPVTEVTGRAFGNITLEVESDLSILLVVDTVDFGTGFVNETNKPVLCGDNATMTAAQTYADRDDCWTNDTATPGPFEIINEGNINATLSVNGPTSNTFYGGFPDAWLYRRLVNNESNSCTENNAASFAEFSGGSQILCNNLAFEGGNDAVDVEIRVVIPYNLNPGTYSDQTIEFTAS